MLILTCLHQRAREISLPPVELGRDGQAKESPHLKDGVLNS
ncbi:unnamed protein product [Spirodela intermedia]|uniref:Uncharacterized protein n=1 Tax=Spirodela intermedia TaxID=51605 RepID=A0A7I8J0Q3_SPIIN|nr:unnamed protein product [Spirodela intermedia]CAA6663542.1 unnamed protein product [Spirodela intermedia]